MRRPISFEELRLLAVRWTRRPLPAAARIEGRMSSAGRHLLDSGFRQMAAIPESAKLFMSGLIERARKLKKTIAFPEGTDPRVLEAAARLAREGVVKPVLIGARPANAPEGVEFVDPATSPLVEEVRRALLRAAARQGHHAGGSGGGRAEAAVLRVADGGRGRCRWQRGRRGQQHGGDGARGAARGGRASARAAGLERLHHGAAGSLAGAQRADGVRRLRGGDRAQRRCRWRISPSPRRRARAC